MLKFGLFNIGLLVNIEKLCYKIEVAPRSHNCLRRYSQLTKAITHFR